MKQILHWNTDHPALNATLFVGLHGYLPPISGATNEPAIYTPWSSPGTFRNLKAVRSAAPGVGVTVTYTLMKNLVATALTVSIAHPATSASDTTHSVAVAATDILSIRITVSSGPAQANVNFALDFDSDTSTGSGYCRSTRLNVTSNNPRQTGACFAGRTTDHWTELPVEYTADDYMPLGGIITRADFLHGMPGAGGGGWVAMASGDSVEFAWVLNDVVQDGSGGTTDTRATMTHPATTATWAGSLTIPAGSRLRMQATPVSMNNGGSPSYAMAFSFNFEATTHDRFWIADTLLMRGNVDAVRYGNMSGHRGVSGTEGLVSGRGAASDWWLVSIHSLTSPGTQRFQVRSRVNGADPITGPLHFLTTSLQSGTGPNTDTLTIAIVGTATSPPATAMPIGTGDTWSLSFTAVPPETDVPPFWENPGLYGGQSPQRTLIMIPSTGTNYSRGRAVTLVSGTALTHYSEANLTDDSMQTVLRVAETSITFYIDLLSAVTPGALAILNHNIDVGAVLQVYFSDSIAGTEQQIAVTSVQPHLWIDLRGFPVTRRYVRIRTGIAAANSKPITIGEVVVGSLEELKGVIDPGSLVRTKSFKSAREFTEEMIPYRMVSGVYNRRLDLTLELDPTTRSIIEAVCDDAGMTGYRVLVIPDSRKNDPYFIDWPDRRDITFPRSDRITTTTFTLPEETPGVIN